MRVVVSLTDPDVLPWWLLAGIGFLGMGLLIVVLLLSDVERQDGHR